MLKDPYLLANIGADTAENERTFAEVLPNAHRARRGPAAPGRRAAGPLRPRAPRGRLRGARQRRAPPDRRRRTRRVVASFWQKFGKMLLVFGCIGTDFCK